MLGFEWFESVLNNGGGDVLKGLILVKIWEFLCNKSALYRGAFFIWVKKGYCICPHSNNETGSFVLREVPIWEMGFEGYNKEKQINSDG